MFTEPLSGWRYADAQEKRTRQDWAREIDWLLTKQYPNAEKVVLVMDNLNTHSIASLYATFPPQYARSLVERLEIHYTPKHGSWLDIAEIELSALGRASALPTIVFPICLRYVNCLFCGLRQETLHKKALIGSSPWLTQE